MLPVRKHSLLAVDFQSAYAWYQAKQPELGRGFIEDFRCAYKRLRQGPLLYSVRFANIHRLNLERFPYGIFYVVTPTEIRVLALLHASRDTEAVLADRRRSFSAIPP
jgi:plasmid stabilization system protein ParE